MHGPGAGELGSLEEAFIPHCILDCPGLQESCCPGQPGEWGHCLRDTRADPVLLSVDQYEMELKNLWSLGQCSEIAVTHPLVLLLTSVPCLWQCHAGPVLHTDPEP